MKKWWEKFKRIVRTRIFWAIKTRYYAWIERIKWLITTIIAGINNTLTWLLELAEEISENEVDLKYIWKRILRKIYHENVWVSLFYLNLILWTFILIIFGLIYLYYILNINAS